MTDLVPRLVENDRRVLYIGDHEVGGPADSIEANTRRVLEEGAGRSIAWKRIALTTEQVDADSRLLGLAIEKIDKRFKPPRPYQAVECEAAGQLELERLLRQTLDALLPEPLDRVLVREGAERDAAIELLRSARPWRRPR
jgi:hypothetical protein